VILWQFFRGHIGLVTTKFTPKKIKALRITGLVSYEKCYGRKLPKRGDYDYIKKKSEDVFYDPAGYQRNSG
jgi:hypothetical protein